VRGARTSISMPQTLFERAQQRQLELGYGTFSDYIQALIRADALTGAAHVREPVTPYRTSTSSEPTPPTPTLSPMERADLEEQDVVANTQQTPSTAVPVAPTPPPSAPRPRSKHSSKTAASSD